MVSGLSMFFMAVTVILAAGVPVGCFIYFYKKMRISWKPVLIGALVFAFFALLLEQLLHHFMFQVNAQTAAWLKNPYWYAVYGSLAAGLFEEIGRYIGFRYVLHGYREWKDGLAYGIGHGGIEALLLGALTAINNLILSFLINSGGTMSEGGEAADAWMAAKEQLVNTPAYLFSMGGVERVFAFILHLALSLLVLYAVRNRKAIFLFVAILVHAGVNFITILLAEVLQFNILAVEGFLLIIAILSVGFIVKSKALFSASGSV